MTDNVLCALGEAYIKNSQFEDAEYSFTEALKFSTLNWNIHSGLAKVAEVKRDTAGARRFHEQAIELAEKWSSYQQGSAIASFFEQVHPVYKEAARFYARQGDHERAWKTVEMVKARYLAYLADQGNIRFHNDVPSVFIDSLTQTEHKINLWYQEYLTGRMETEKNFEVYALESEKARYLDSIKTHRPDYYDLRKPGIVSIGELHEKTAGRCQFLEYALMKDSLIGIVIRDGQVTTRIEPVDYRSLKERIADVVSSQNPKADNLRYLYRVLFAPWEPLLEAGRELVIIPDDILFYLPFEMLIAGEGKEHGHSENYLIRKYPVSYAVSASMFINQSEMASHASRNYLGLASSGFTAQDPLPYAVKQTEAAQDVFSGADIFEDQRLHKARLLNGGHEYKIIDLATHVILSDADPMFSHILFHDNADSAVSSMTSDSSQRLYIYEMYNRALPADMLVLSGCESGRGRFSSGEGFIGFLHALTYAGTASAVLSLWPAEDQSTCELMRLFYRHLDQGESRTRALQKAKIEYMETSPALKRSPHFWAAFTLWGNPDKINLNQDHSMIYIAVTLSALGLCCWIMVILKKRSVP